MTSNAGEAWRRVFWGSSQQIDFDPFVPNRIYVASEAGIFSVKEDEIVSVRTGNAGLPSDVALCQNYPNPFNSQTTIRYYVNRTCPVTIRLFDIQGGEVRKYPMENRQQGFYGIQWDGTDQIGRPVATGVYFCRFETYSRFITKKLVVLRYGHLSPV